MIINIVPGNRKPYYLKDKGLKPSGVYLRYGRNKTQANYEEIIVVFLKEHKSIRRTTVEDVLEIKATKAKEIIKEMLDKKIIIQVGNRPSTTYRLND